VQIGRNAKFILNFWLFGTSLLEMVFDDEEE
jgi:hypothetical protein